MSNRYLELHILQSFVPSNLNRDDNNQPKSTDFGGARRARVSSQSFKHAMRHSEAFALFTDPDDKKPFAERLRDIRTRRMMDLLLPRLVAKKRSEAEAEVVIKAFMTVYAGLDDKNNNLSSVLVFLSQEDVAAMVEAIDGHWEAILNAVPQKDGKRSYPKEKLKKDKALTDALKAIAKKTETRTSAPNVALFGRMLADNPEFALEAACQVAHAISTHAVETEYDYFTAMDDLQSKEETGAGTIQITGFNSACYYRYLCVDWELLTANLQKQGLAEPDLELAQATVNALLRAALEATPTGMNKRFAQNNPPDFVLAVVRDGGPAWSLANAFEKPIKPKNDSGFIKPSAEALDKYWKRLYDAYEGEGVKAVRFYAISPEADEATPNLSAQSENRALSLKNWRESVVQELTA